MCSSTSSEPASPLSPRPASRAIRAASRRGFYAVAHRAGNNLHHLEEALSARVDAIECDLWHARGRMVLRHERKFPGLPVIFDKWYFRFAWGELSLRRLLKEINFRAELFLDIKSRSPRAADAVLDLYRDNASMMPHTLISSHRWSVLDRIAQADTDLELFYSVGSESAMESLLRRPAHVRPAAGTSIRHTLLSEESIERLHAAGLQVFAWTVNTSHRARELRAWGVEGIIADDTDVLNEGLEFGGV